MKLAALPAADARRRLHAGGLALGLGPFIARVRTTLPGVVEPLLQLYADYTVHEGAQFADFDVRLAAPSVLRRLLRPQVQFYNDDHAPFKPLPLEQGFAMFEWGLNWCVASSALQYLVVHAAVVERGGHAALLPGAPGAGKSTLCAGLISRGWRLLSDEMALLVPGTDTVVPIPRPVSLKNESIEVIRRFRPGAQFGPVAHDTAKGTVAHLRPPADAVARAGQSATVRWVIYPLWVAGAPYRLMPRSRSDAMLHLARNSMTYDALGAEGFEALAGVIDACDCYDLRYGDLEEATERLGELAAEAASA